MEWSRPIGDLGARRGTLEGWMLVRVSGLVSRQTVAILEQLLCLSAAIIVFVPTVTQRVLSVTEGPHSLLGAMEYPTFLTLTVPNVAT